jgi:hypothetical protein
MRECVCASAYNLTFNSPCRKVILSALSHRKLIITVHFISSLLEAGSTGSGIANEKGEPVLPAE